MAFPGCSLSAWEIDTCGTLPGGPERFTLGLFEARTRERLCTAEVRVGDEGMRLLVSIVLDPGPEESLVLGFTVYRVESTSLEPLMHGTVEDASAHAIDLMPRGMSHTGGWNKPFLNLQWQVIQCWCTPDPGLESDAIHQYERGTPDGFMMTGGSIERPELLRYPLARWPEPVWVLTLTPAGP